ncbi:MAG: 50S ribosome-binding GTPase [Bacilli bacterium]|nr:50S ribosome-binding GTPase [Bacilli bacterium]
MNKKCVGCGILLQTQNKENSGYVSDLNFSYCERCFRNINYSEINDLNVAIDNHSIIDKINKKSDLVFFVADLLNLSEDLIKIYKKISKPKYFVINKIDVLPKSITLDKITNLLKNEYKITENIIYTSKNNSNLLDKIEKAKNIYFCGLSNSGKSTIISNLTGNNNLIKSYMLNSTQDYNIVDFEDKKIIDCPGFVLVSNLQNDKLLKIILPSKKINPRTFQISKEVTLNFHDIFSIRLEDENSVTCYISNGLVIKKIYKEIAEYDEITIPSNSDLIIKGIGFINIKNKTTIKITKNLIVDIRNSIFK